VVTEWFVEDCDLKNTNILLLCFGIFQFGLACKYCNILMIFLSACNWIW